MTNQELKNLLDQMTLEEKVFQMMQLTGQNYHSGGIVVGSKDDGEVTPEIIANAGSTYGILGAKTLRDIQDKYLETSRLKIPLIFMGDIIYGYKTVFPIPIALGSAWDFKLVEDSLSIVAKEAAAAGIQCTFSPMIDLTRDPRWGRVMEGAGESVFLTSEYAKAAVKGFQGDLNPAENMVACIKHFAGYGAPEGGRDYNTVDMTERTLRQEYLPAYKAAVDAGCAMVMTSFNTIDGIPANGNKWLMRDVLRDEWGFDGVTVSDYCAHKELVFHGVAKDEAEAGRMSLEAGVDFEMATFTYMRMIEEGNFSEELIDESVMRILELKNKMGLFENPYGGACEQREKEVLLAPENLELARHAATKTTVLLKNDKNVLPLKSEQKVALIGPYADSKSTLGFWALAADYSAVVTLKEGLAAYQNVTYAKGCSTLADASELGELGSKYFGRENMSDEEKEEARNEAIKLAKESDVVVMAVGEHAFQTGEGASRTDLTLPTHQVELINEISKLGKKIVLVVYSGRPLVLTNVVDKVDSILMAWFPGTQGGNAIADILYGKVNPSGKLSMSFPHSVGQIPVYHSMLNTGRPAGDSTRQARFTSKYLDCPNDALFPFGHGLSYTNYSYGEIKLDKSEMTPDGKIVVSVDVTNNGAVAGEEVVQLYLRDLVGSVSRPVKELKGFERIQIEAGATKKVTFEINEEMLKFYRQDMSYGSETGKFLALVGSNSTDLISAEFVLI